MTHTYTSTMDIYCRHQSCYSGLPYYGIKRAVEDKAHVVFRFSHYNEKVSHSLNVDTWVVTYISVTRTVVVRLSNIAVY